MLGGRKEIVDILGKVDPEIQGLPGGDRGRLPDFLPACRSQTVSLHDLSQRLRRGLRVQSAHPASLLYKKTADGYEL